MLPIISIIGVPRIGLGPHVPETRILPLYYTPIMEIIPQRVYCRYTILRPIKSARANRVYLPVHLPRKCLGYHYTTLSDPRWKHRAGEFLRLREVVTDVAQEVPSFSVSTDMFKSYFLHFATRSLSP